MTFNLTREQTMAVMHGIGPNKMWAEPVELPTMAEVPDWCLDADTHYLFGDSAKYSNRPKLHLKVKQGCEHWEPELYDYDERRGFYYTLSGDDRMHGYYHKPLRPQTVSVSEKVEGKWQQIEKEVWATPQEEGFAGRHFHIKMRDGRDAILRGPWHGCPPAGWVDVTYHLWPPKYGMYRRIKGDTRKPWRACMGYFGWYISEDLFLRIMAKYLPHLRAARVHSHGMTYIEPCIDGQPPKGFTDD